MSFHVSSSNPLSLPPTPLQHQQHPSPSLGGGSFTNIPGGNSSGGSGFSPPIDPTTPIPAPYVSLNAGGSGSRSGMPPPFSLGPAQGGMFSGQQGQGQMLGGPGVESPETGMMSGSLTNYPGPPGTTLGGGGGNSPPPSNGQQQGLGRAGTDPTKYKTTICRNWEQNGTCQFRGCTFAHGVDDLRPPNKVGTSPVLNSVPQATMQQLLSGNSPQASLKIEQIAELLITEVNRQRDLVSVHVEANRTLENMLKREQQLRTETTAQLDAVRADIQSIAYVNHQKDQEILQLTALAENQGRKTLDSFATTFNKSPKLAATNPHGNAAAHHHADPQQSHQHQQLPQSSTHQYAADYVSPPDGSPTATDDQLRNILSGLNIS